MLVLTRKKDEGINIGNDIQVYLMSAGRARIGIVAPDNVAITRTSEPPPVGTEPRQKKKQAAAETPQPVKPTKKKKSQTS